MTESLPAIVRVRITMKPSANKRGTIVNHGETVVRCSYIHFSLLSGGLCVSAEDIDRIEILPAPQVEETFVR